VILGGVPGFAVVLAQQASEITVWFMLVLPALVVLAVGVFFIVSGLRPQGDDDQFPEPTMTSRIREAWWRMRFRLMSRQLRRGRDDDAD
jgi:hypothetical protein